MDFPDEAFTFGPLQFRILMRTMDDTGTAILHTTGTKECRSSWYPAAGILILSPLDPRALLQLVGQTHQLTTPFGTMDAQLTDLRIEDTTDYFTAKARWEWRHPVHS